ncbi:unnamed protein product [Knipowitschia caucasica]|uniref:Transmembrane protein 125 n=1 Tax=Knipowitschia caucasica TaxID=637954 RepID=A0AAV2JTA8_KNICA
MSHLQIHHHRPLQLEPAMFHRRVLDEQLELWWSRQPRQSLLCYCSSVALIMGLGVGGVGVLSTTSSLSGEWRLAVGTALCLLSLVVLLKQLLSSAIQDMNCVRNRHRIDQLRSGGHVDPVLFLAVGSTVSVCGTVLLCVASAHRERDKRDMLLFGAGLLSAGAALTLAAGLYCILLLVKRRNSTYRAPRMRTMSTPTVPMFTVSGQNMSSSRTSLI